LNRARGAGRRLNVKLLEAANLATTAGYLSLIDERVPANVIERVCRAASEKGHARRSSTPPIRAPS
jgi:hypothetical protein